MLDTSSTDFYNLLQIPRDASPKDVKAAYHRTLLRLHPDKRPARHRDHNTTSMTTDSENEVSVDVALLKEAYITLSDTRLRMEYDASSLSALRREGVDAWIPGPRPAQVISLEEFAVSEGETGEHQKWWYGCRCGGTYHVTQDDLENGAHLVSCQSCSEVIWIGYEEAVEDEDELDSGA